MMDCDDIRALRKELVLYHLRMAADEVPKLSGKGYDPDVDRILFRISDLDVLIRRL